MHERGRFATGRAPGVWTIVLSKFVIKIGVMHNGGLWGFRWTLEEDDDEEEGEKRRKREGSEEKKKEK